MSLYIKMGKLIYEVSKPTLNILKNQGVKFKTATESQLLKAAKTNEIKRMTPSKARNMGGDARTTGTTRTKKTVAYSTKKTRADSTKKTRADSRKKPRADSTKKTEEEISTQTLRGVVNKKVSDLKKGRTALNRAVDVGKTVMRGGKKVGTVVMQGGKKFIKSPTGRLIAVGAAASAGTYYLTSGSGDKPKPTQAASTASKPKPPKPTVKPPKPDYAGASFTDTEEATLGENDKPKKLSFEDKLRAKFIKGRGGKDAFKSDKQINSAFESELMEMREGADAGFSLKDQEDYQKVMDERGSKGKKAGGQVKRKYGGVVKRRGGMQVGKVTNPSRIKSTIRMANGGGVGNELIASLYKKN